MRTLRLTTRLLFTALILLVAMADALQLRDDRIPPVAASRAQHQALIIRVLDLTNAERAKAGVAPLSLQSNLNESASWLAEDMAKNSYLDHADTRGRNLAKRAGDFKYQEWKNLGENIAGGPANAEAVLKQWLSSPNHRKNLLNPTFKEIGIGYAFSPDSEFDHYWVQDFGTRN